MSGSVYLGDLGSGESKTFSIQVSVGQATVPSITFSASSADHITLDFPVSVLVAAGVTPQSIAQANENIEQLSNIIDQGLTYTVYQVGSMIFPSTSQGVTSSSDLSQLIQGYFVQNYLQHNSQAIDSSIISLANTISTAISSAASASNAAVQSYTISIPLLLSTYTYSATLADFLTYSIPVSQWIPGAQDIRVADLLANAANCLFGPRTSSPCIPKPDPYYPTSGE